MSSLEGTNLKKEL